MKLKNIILFGTAAMALTACDDLFEPALENNQGIEEMYADPQFARGLIDNAFLVLPYDNAPQSDLATDDAVSNDNSNNYKKMATGAWTSESNPVNQWDTRYHAIQYCNLFLENIDKVQWDYTSESLNQMHMDLYRGQAYALRGLHMFYLLRAHCGMVDGQLMGVPIHLTSENQSSNFNLPRNTFKECVDQIMADLDEAMKYVPDQYGDVSAGNVPAKYTQIGGNDAEYNRAFGNMQRGKIDARIIKAIKAQVALFAASPAYASAGAMTWEQAAKLAADYLNIRGGLAAVDPTGWNWFAQTSFINNWKFTDADPVEMVWRGTVGDSKDLEADNYPPSIHGKGRVNPTQNLVDAFPTASGYPIAVATDYDAQNPYENRDPRLKAYILVNGDKIGNANTVINTQADATTLDGLNRENQKSTTTGYYMRKHLRADVNLTPGSETKQRHFGARIRTTELLLDYAEAANEAQGPTANVGGANFSAYDVIKAIRARVHDAGWEDTYLESIKTDQSKMRDLIRNERRLELCFENSRFWDLRRWQAPLNETAKGMSITANASTGGVDYKKIDVEPRAFEDYMIYGPIPYSECLKWSELKQNDGWK